ncbi:MAG: glycosyltransferase family 39 protein [Dehalococcoidia bacterium]
MAAVDLDPFSPEPHNVTFYDGAFYYNAGRGLADGAGYTGLNGEATNLFPPGYPLVLAGSFLLFGDGLMVGKLVNAFLGAVTVVLVYALATKVVDRRVGLVAAAIMAVYPAQILSSALLMTEVLFTGLAALLLLLLVAWTAERRASTWQLLTLGLLVGFMTLVRTEALLLIPALLVLWKLLTPSWQETGRYAALLLIAALPLLLAWSMRNYVELGDLELRSGGGTALRMGISPNFDAHLTAWYFGVAPPPIADTLRHFATHPWDVGVLALRKLAFLFRDDADVVKETQKYVPQPLSDGAGARWSALTNWYYYAVGVLAMIGIAAWLRTLDRRRLVVLWFVASWSLIYLLFVPQGRYHLPVVPVLATTAAFAAVSAWQFAQDGGVARAVASLRHELLPPQPALAPVLAFAVLVVAIATTIAQGRPDAIAPYRDIARRNDLLKLAGSVSDFSQRFGGFPSTGGLDQSEPLCVSDSDLGCVLRAVMRDEDLPVDPFGDPEKNGYWFASDGQTVVLYALRETGAYPSCPSPPLLGKKDLQCLRLP